MVVSVPVAALHHLHQHSNGRDCGHFGSWGWILLDNQLSVAVAASVLHGGDMEEMMSCLDLNSLDTLGGWFD
jgi:hypothetical protein